MVIVVFGMPGPGRSSFASGLAKRLRCSYFNWDGMHRELEMNRGELSEAMRQNREIVVDLVFPTQDIRNAITHEARDAGGELFIEVRGSPSDLQPGDRVKQPGDRVKQPWQAMDDAHLVLYSTDNDMETLINIAYDHLHLKHIRRTDL